MKAALAFLISILVSFLPPPWRRWWRHDESEELAFAAFISGILQMLTFFVLHLVHLFYFFEFGMQRAAREALMAGQDIDMPMERFGMSLGLMGWIEYMLHPVSLLLTYFLIEGSLRMIAGLAAKQAVATLPLHLLAMLQRGVARHSAERALGSKIVDRVETGDGPEFDLRIHTCRLRENWDRLMTISYRDNLYEIAEQTEGAPPHRFIYTLRKMPPGKVVRGMHHYRPDEIVNPGPSRP